MKQLLRTIAKLVSIIGAGVALFSLVCIGIINNYAHASQTAPRDGSVITIHDRNITKSIVTEDATIGEALKDAGISLAKQDVVEPSANLKITSNSYQVNIYRARPVIVIDGATREKVMTPYQTAAQIAKSVGITLYPEDTTTITQSNDVADGAGLEMVITRATPFNFTLYGSAFTARTQAKTVGDMLKQKGVVLGANDRVSPDASTPITANMTVRVWREGEQTITVQESVPFGTTTIQDANQSVGYSAIQTPGQNGVQNTTYQINVVNGQEVSRTAINTIVITPAVQQVEVIGTKITATAGYSAQQTAIMTAAGIASSDQGYAAYIVNHENGMWCPTRWQGESICPSGYIDGPVYGYGPGYGLCQATPAGKMATAGSDWETNAVTQMEWCSSYAISRYGSWGAAASHWEAAHSW